MQAQCPKCIDASEGFFCDECQNTKLIDVSIAQGDIFTRVCLNKEECGFVNGGHVGIPDISSEPCIICDGPTDWVLCSEVEEADEPGWAKNREKWEIHSLNKNVIALRKIIFELREFGRKHLPETITVEEARLLNVCRVCKKSSPEPNYYGYGSEYAHTKCL